MSAKSIPLYDGAIKAHKVGGFIMGGEMFHIIRPGYDVQGQRRIKWTQFVHEDVPIFQVKTDMRLEDAIAHFTAQFDKTFSGDALAKLPRALKNSKAEHRRKFRDGVTGVEPAATTTLDGPAEGVVYTG